MADLPNDFWSGWIIVITGLSFAAMVWLVFSIYFSKQADIDHPDNKEPVWDENLREGLNAPPLWWFWLIFSAMIFSVIYLILYPGMGAFKGVLNWSQDSRVAGSYAVYNESFDSQRQAIVDSSLQTLQQNSIYMSTAERLFDRHCAACHGSDGRGQANMFPNLMDEEWQWGGTPQQIEQTLRNGRMAVMIPWQQMVGDEGVNQLANYVVALGKDETEGHPGQALFNQNCIACHNTDATGNPLLGAPNLTDDTWLYGGDLDAVKTSIGEGRNGVMPAFKDRLDDVQIKLLVAWLSR